MIKMTGKILCLAGLASALAGCVTPPPPPQACRVDSRPKTPAATELSTAVAGMVRGDLTRLGYLVTTDRYVPKKNQETVSINLLFDRREAARLDKWTAYDASVSVRVVSERGLLLGEKTFEAKGKRGSSTSDAEAGIRQSLANQLRSWLPQVLPAPSSVPLPPPSAR